MMFSSFAQKGFLRGKITDAETGEALIGATVSKQGTTVGAVADFDGNYSLALDPGTHTIVFQFVSYQTKTVENIEIKAEEVTPLDISLGADVEQLAEVVVQAEIIKDSEVAVLALQRKSANVLDGVSSQTFQKTGDSNLAGAIKRVTGVSVQGGKYVYVRGLGDRYTRTTLNGLSIPGLDPERNDVQIDLFPTNVLENVLVYKTFTPDLSADFTGGTVNVETKSFPEEKTTTVSVGFGFNPDMHFIDNFLTYDGGDLDFLGIDDGNREIPFDPFVDIPDRRTAIDNNDPSLEGLTRSLNPTMGAKRVSNFTNASFGFSHGNQLDKEKYKIGYNFVLNYQRNTEYYGNAQLSSIYFKDPDLDVTALDLQANNNGDLGRINVLWSALGTISLKTDKSQFGLNILRTQNGLTETSDRVRSDIEETGQTVFEDILTYSQRSISNATLSGKHNFNKFLLEWGNSFTISRVYDPDFRSTSIVEVLVDGTDEVVYSIRPGQGGIVGRFWRDLNEMNENFRVDLTYNLAEKNKLKTGGQVLLKWREFETYNYNIASTLSRVENDPQTLLAPENIWTISSNSGNYLTGNIELPNIFDARSSVFAGYVMNDITLGRLRSIYGVRVEQANMFYTGQDRFAEIEFDDEQTLDELNLLPAVNLVYSFSENTNLRGSYGRTLARPSFKEKSIAQILDPITSILFNGNIDLEQTIIDNFDLRFENFFGAGEMVSLSGFYKRFDGHIEMTRFETEPQQVTPRNIGGSVVYGLELEFRKNLDFLLSGLAVGSNLSLQRSSVDLNEVFVDAEGTKTEFESRQEQARTGETQEDTRDMAGQAPYLINAYMNYADTDGTYNVNLSYNVQGENLSVVGIGQVPDVYTRPFNSLNLNASRQIGGARRSKITLGITNILNDEVEEFYKNFGDVEATFSLFEVGRTFSLSYAYTF